MEAENDGFLIGISFSRGSFSGSMWVFRWCSYMLGVAPPPLPITVTKRSVSSLVGNLYKIFICNFYREGAAPKEYVYDWCIRYVVFRWCERGLVLAEIYVITWHIMVWVVPLPSSDEDLQFIGIPVHLKLFHVGGFDCILASGHTFWGLKTRTSSKLSENLKGNLGGVKQ